MKWNDDWRMEAEREYTDCFYRLCDCRNNRNDISIIARLMLKYNPTKTAEECLDRTLEWIGDWNSQYELTDLTPTEYEKILKKLLTNKVLYGTM